MRRVSEVDKDRLEIEYAGANPALLSAPIYIDTATPTGSS